MIDWILCFIFSVVLLLAALLLVLKDRGKFFAKGMAFILEFIAAYVIYIPIIFRSYNIFSSILGTFVNSFQVISLDAGYLDQYDIVVGALGDTGFAYAYMFVLGIIHFSLPILSAIVAISFLLHWIKLIKIKLFERQGRDVYIFSCASEKAIEFALDIYKNLKQLKKNCSFIFLDDKDKRDLLPAELKGLHTTICEEDDFSFNFGIKNNKKDIHYFAMCDSDDKNIDDALSFIKKYSSYDREIQKHIHLYVFSKLPETECMIDSTQKGIMDIHIIDETKLAVYNLLDSNPLYQYVENGVCSVLIVGMEQLGIYCLKTVIWMGQLYGFDLKINLIDYDIENKMSQAIEELPELFPKDSEKESANYDISCYSVAIDSVDFDDTVINSCYDTTYCVICGNDDSKNINTALKLRRAFLKNDPEFKKNPFIAVHIKSGVKHEIVRNMATSELNPSRKVNYTIVPFGGDNVDGTYKQVVDSDINWLAKNVHMAYEEIFSGSDTVDDIDAALEKYNVLEINKSSNLANAMHIKYKLWVMGLTYVPEDSTDEEEVDFSSYLADEDFLYQLTYVEHDRWMAFLRSEGWIGSSIEQVKKYQASGVSGGRHNCPMLKMHPFICPFEQLPEVSEQLGQQDATIYDKLLIAKIPDILHDKWNISGKRYKIIKYKEIK